MEKKTAEEILQQYALAKSRFMQIEYQAEDVIEAMKEYAAQETAGMYDREFVKAAITAAQKDAFNGKLIGSDHYLKPQP